MRLNKVLGFGLAALLLASMANFAGAMEMKLGSTVVTLTPPNGQCPLSAETEPDAAIFEKQRQLMSGSAKLLAEYLDCDQLAKLRSGNWIFSDYATYTIPWEAFYKTAPTGIVPKACAVARTRITDQGLAEIIKKNEANVERAYEGKIELNEAKSLGVLAEEPTACYMGQVVKTKARSADKETLQVIVIAMVQIKDKVFHYQIYAPYVNSESVSKLLTKHRANVAALVSANSK